jgi:hypothetical protein
MAKTNIPGVIVSKTVPWTAKGWVFKRAPAWMGNREALSVYQLKQNIRLAEAAHAAYGTKGKMNYKGFNMPAIAVKIAPQISGSVGGKTPAERARIRHEEVTPRSIEALRAILARKGGA